MSLIVVCVIVALAAIWYYDADGVKPGILGPWYTEPADPGTTSFVPRPDWYFYFLFYLLRIFKWPETVFIATVGIPTICLDPPHRAAVLRPAPRAASDAPPGRDGRRRAHDPLDGRPDLEGRDREGGARLRARPARALLGARNRASPGTRRRRRARRSSRSRAASTATRTSGREQGNLGAPDLSAIGASNDAAFFVQYLTNPAAFGNNVMGSYSYLGEENLAALGAFLAASKGPK